MRRKFFFLFFFLILCACSKELIYTKEDLLKIALTADSSVSIILPKTMAEGASCNDYPEGCLSAHIVKVRNLELIAVEFTNEAQALFAAKKMRGFYIRNWLLDDVTGEPDLERFAAEGLKAKKP